METGLSLAVMPTNVITSSPAAAARTRAVSTLCSRVIDTAELFALSLLTVVVTQYVNSNGDGTTDQPTDNQEPVIEPVIASHDDGLFYQQTHLTDAQKLLKAACACLWHLSVLLHPYNLRMLYLVPKGASEDYATVGWDLVGAGAVLGHKVWLKFVSNALRKILFLLVRYSCSPNMYLMIMPEAAFAPPTVAYRR